MAKRWSFRTRNHGENVNKGNRQIKRAIQGSAAKNKKRYLQIIRRWRKVVWELGDVKEQIRREEKEFGGPTAD